MANMQEIYSMLQDGIKDTNIINQLIQNDGMSAEKAMMIKAENYFNNKNDIINTDFRKYTANGIDKINPNRSNNRISHNFLRLLINQAVNYITGNSITYAHDEDRFQKYLDDYLMFDFDDNNVTWLKESRKKGKGYVHFYYDEAGELGYTVIPSEQIIPIYKDDFKKELVEVIRYYSYALTTEKGIVIRNKVEWWTAKEVRRYIQDAAGAYFLTEIVSHWTYKIDGSPEFVEGHSWDRVPFVELKNNDECISDLQDIKGFIDAYDLIESEFVNQIADVREVLIKVMGYSGTATEEILECFRSTGIVKIDDPTGNIDTLVAEIPVEARKAALENLKKNIYTIGQGVDATPERIGTSISGIALKMMYAPLDLKCSASIRKLLKALYEFMWFITDDYNRRFNASINYKDVKFTFSKNLMVNEAEIIESLAKSKGIISDETIIEKHPYVDDPTLETERLITQEEKQLNEFNKQVMREDI